MNYSRFSFGAKLRRKPDTMPRAHIFPKTLIAQNVNVKVLNMFFEIFLYFSVSVVKKKHFLLD